MKVIPGIKIIGPRLVESDAAEPGPGETAYNPATEYALGARVIVGAPSSTVTLSIADPCVVTWANNGLPNDTPVVLSTNGSLPDGIEPDVIYYVVRRETGAFCLASEPNGPPISTTGAQSGTHTATAHIHRLYESLAAANTGNRPAISADKWQDIGPTNKWAMFDTYRNTRTWAASPATFVVAPGDRADTIVGLGLLADTVTVTVTVTEGDEEVEIYSATEELLTRDVYDIWDYFFGPVEQKTFFYRDDLPLFSAAKITFSATRAVGPVGIGDLHLGVGAFLGSAQYEAESDALNFSEVKRAINGDAAFIKRRSVPTTSQVAFFKKALTRRLVRLRDALNAEVAVWTTLDDPEDEYFEAFIVKGVYKRFLINAAHPDDGRLSLDIEEV